MCVLVVGGGGGGGVPSCKSIIHHIRENAAA